MKTETPVSLAYAYQDSLYLNITPKCPTACTFCIKFSWDYQYRGHNLLLPKEPSVDEVVAAAGDVSSYKQIIFCGYGESTYRLEPMRQIAAALKKKGAKSFRLNTIGLGNAINQRDIAPDLGTFLDAVSISLNTLNPQRWMELHQPQPQFREHGFESVIDFIRCCVKHIPQTWVSAVEGAEINSAEFTKFVENLGAQARIRPHLDDYEAV